MRTPELAHQTPNRFATQLTLLYSHPVSDARRWWPVFRCRSVAGFEVSTEGQLNRALRVMDALIKSFERRGWKVSIATGDDRKTSVTVLGRQVPFGIREKIKKVENPPSKP